MSRLKPPVSTIEVSFPNLYFTKHNHPTPSIPPPPSHPLVHHSAGHPAVRGRCCSRAFNQLFRRAVSAAVSRPSSSERVAPLLQLYPTLPALPLLPLGPPLVLRLSARGAAIVVSSDYTRRRAQVRNPRPSRRHFTIGRPGGGV